MITENTSRLNKRMEHVLKRTKILFIDKVTTFPNHFLFVGSEQWLETAVDSG
jgi:hypothetical protein